MDATVLWPTPRNFLRSLRFGGFSFAAAQEPSGTRFPFIAPAQIANTDIIIDLRTLAEARGSRYPRSGGSAS